MSKNCQMGCWILVGSVILVLLESLSKRAGMFKRVIRLFVLFSRGTLGIGFPLSEFQDLSATVSLLRLGLHFPWSWLYFLFSSLLPATIREFDVSYGPPFSTTIAVYFVSSACSRRHPQCFFEHFFSTPHLCSLHPFVPLFIDSIHSVVISHPHSSLQSHIILSSHAIPVFISVMHTNCSSFSFVTFSLHFFAARLWSKCFSLFVAHHSGALSICGKCFIRLSSPPNCPSLLLPPFFFLSGQEEHTLTMCHDFFLSYHLWKVVTLRCFETLFCCRSFSESLFFFFRKIALDNCAEHLLVFP